MQITPLWNQCENLIEVLMVALSATIQIIVLNFHSIPDSKQ